jgi:hypothetical protein
MQLLQDAADCLGGIHVKRLDRLRLYEQLHGYSCAAAAVIGTGWVTKTIHYM